MDSLISKVVPKISIVIPVYNVEQYLVRCLDSIFNQQFSGLLEVIAVDDASTDSSLQILRNYQAKEARLKVIHHETNKKLSIARATGMKTVSGDYVMHVDSDDWIIENSLECIYKKCLETDVDVLVFNHVRVNNEGMKTYVNSIDKELVTTDKQLVQQYFLGAPWNKIVKRNMVEDMISGQVGVNNGEDLMYTTEVLLKAKSVCLVTGSYYAYFVNTQSLTWVVTTEQFLRNQIIVLNQLQRLILKYTPNEIFINCLMNYFEKWIYLESAKIHFWQKGSLVEDNRLLIRSFFEIPLMNKDRIVKLELSMNNKLINLYEVSKRFGIKTALSIFVRSMKKLFH